MKLLLLLLLSLLLTRSYPDATAPQSFTDDVMREVQKSLGFSGDGVGGPNTKKAILKKYGKGVYEQVVKAQKEQFASQTETLSATMAPKIGKDIDPKWVQNLWMHETKDGTRVLGSTYNVGNIKGSFEGKSRKFTVNEYMTDKQIASEKKKGTFVKLGKGTRNGRKEVFVKDPFRQYENFEEGARDFADLLNKPRYKKVKIAKTQKEFITELKKAGYFTDSVDAYLKGVQARD